MKKKEKQGAFAVAIIIIVISAVAAYEVISIKPSAWQIDAQLSNSGSQDTTAFTMNSTWAISWVINKQNDNLFTVTVYMKNDSGYFPVTDASETDTNTTRGVLPVPYTGTFIVRVVASSETQWTLQIEELKPA